MGNFFDKYELYTEGESVYCIPKTGVLKNKLNIEDIQELRNAEKDFVSARNLELELYPIQGDFDQKRLYMIHKYLFQDCYDFAGETRHEDISKGNTKFCVSIYIDDQLTELFEKIKKTGAKKSDSLGTKIDFLAYLMSELNIIHPFREGNGRAIREFVREYADSIGLRVRWNAIETERLMDAMIASVADTSDLKTCLKIVAK